MANDNDKLKKFLNWVNADDGLPHNEEQDHNHDVHDDHDSHDDHGHEVHDDHGHEVHDDHKIHDQHDEYETEDILQNTVDEELEYSEIITGISKDKSHESSTEAHVHTSSNIVAKQNLQLIKEQKKQLSSVNLFYHILSPLLAVIIIAALLITVAYLPPFGNPLNPTNNEVYTRYVENGVEETGAINVVAGMILDYRAFDTLGESIVLFTAVISVIMLIRTVSKSSDVKSSKVNENMNIKKYKNLYESDEVQPLILRTIVMPTVPFIMIYGIYIILNGHLSPGGGFSGGAILGAGLSLYALAFGAKKTRKMFNFKTYTLCSSIALIFYALVKGYAFCMGASGLNTGIPLGTPGNILSAGLILPLNICVGIVVACTVYGIYALFSEGEV